MNPPMRIESAGAELASTQTLAAPAAHNTAHCIRGMRSAALVVFFTYAAFSHATTSALKSGFGFSTCGT